MFFSRLFAWPARLRLPVTACALVCNQRLADRALRIRQIVEKEEEGSVNWPSPQSAGNAAGWTARGSENAQQKKGGMTHAQRRMGRVHWGGGEKSFWRRTEKKCDFCRQHLEAGKGKMQRTSPQGFLYDGDLEKKKKKRKKAECMGCLKVCMHG